MPIFTMLFRSILSYTIFLASRRIVQGSLGAGEAMKKHFKLHRCTDCWRLYSGEINECNFCGSFVKPLYKIYEEEISRPYYQRQQYMPEKREGLERQVYNDTRGLKFEPLKPPQLGMKYDRQPAQNSREPSRSNQGRDRESLGDQWYNRVLCS